jgi:hypothetical protein
MNCYEFYKTEKTLTWNNRFPLHISPYSLAENPLEEKPFTQLDPDHGRRWGRHKSGQNPAGDVAGDEGKREGEHEES